MKDTYVMNDIAGAAQAAPAGNEPAAQAAREALLASVDTLSVSEELKERWRVAAKEDAALILPTFFVRCADIGYACLPTLIRRAFAEKGVAFEDLQFVYRTLGEQHVDAMRMVFTPEETAVMAIEERLAATRYSLEHFLDIYRFMPSMQAKKAAELARIAAEAAEKADSALAALGGLAPASTEHEACLRELSAATFIRILASSIEKEGNI